VFVSGTLSGALNTWWFFAGVFCQFVNTQLILMAVIVSRTINGTCCFVLHISYWVMRIDCHLWRCWYSIQLVELSSGER
jgi:hypothetical protein